MALCKSVRSARGILADIGFIVVVAVWIYGMFRPAVASWIEQNAHIPATWNPYILIAFLAYFLLRANYDDFSAIEQQAKTHKAEAEELRGVLTQKDARRVVRDEIGHGILIGTYLLLDSPKVLNEFQLWETAAKEWLESCQHEVKAKIGEAESIVLVCHREPMKEHPQSLHAEHTALLNRVAWMLAGLRQLLDSLPQA